MAEKKIDAIKDKMRDNIANHQPEKNQTLVLTIQQNQFKIRMLKLDLEITKLKAKEL